MMQPPSQQNGYLAAHAGILRSSFRKWLGVELLEAIGGTPPDGFAKALFNANSVVVSHDTADDPVFNYGNRIALDLFEMTWSEFTQLPSRKSAEPLNREERARLLATVSEQNFVDDYSGVRISSSGRRFFIPQAIVWNLVDDAGIYRGQAAMFSEWQFL